jgi:hypothetical protein
MDTASPASLPRSRPAAAILVGGLLGGGFDLAFALIFYGLRGVAPMRVMQSIASGLLGMESFRGGWPTAILGVGCHFVIALGAATVFYLASRRLRFMTDRAVISGTLFGACIYFFMHLVVLPLSAAPKFKHTAVSVVSDFAVHLFLIGPSIALAMRRYARR